jgi:D-xylonolactonase
MSRGDTLSILVNAEVIVESGNVLGESVFWSVPMQKVHWVDGSASVIHRWDPRSSTHDYVELAPRNSLGMIAETTDPQSIAIADPNGIALVNLETRDRSSVAHPEQGRHGVGYNDAKVDPAGRLWVGTFDLQESEPRGCLWLLESGRPPHLAETGMAVVNGPAFSPNGGVLYVSDSMGKRILAFDLDGRELGRRRVLAHLSPEEGLPDGLTVDAEGCVWCAHWDGARVTRFSPRGERLAVIHAPVPRVTSVAFGGSDLKTLFFTSARYGLTQHQLELAPKSGALFSASPGVQGIAATRLPLPFVCREMA